jgi:hypothetical protein
METKYKLMTFGIKVDEIPVTSSGTPKTKNLLQWIKTRKAIDERRRVLAIRQLRGEEQRQQRIAALAVRNKPAIDFNASPTMSSASGNVDYTVGSAATAIDRDSLGTIIVHPGIHDVLIAKGGRCNHWGNIDFLFLMSMHQQEYKDLPKRSPRRKEIRDKLIQAVHERNGRFLEMDNEIVSTSNNRHNKCTSGVSRSGNNKTRSDSGDWWREITDQADLDDRIKTAMYDCIRRKEQEWYH